MKALVFPMSLFAQILMKEKNQQAAIRNSFIKLLNYNHVIPTHFTVRGDCYGYVSSISIDGSRPTIGCRCPLK
ncbi:hypothetical protein FE783_32570 [Paenibacillus mesophilus]|nr:hypothetical protein FE783_32570 [Paenibacillus mesophilus]